MKNEAKHDTVRERAPARGPIPVVDDDPLIRSAVRDLLEDVSGLKRSVGFRLPEGDLTCVVGLGSTLWDRLFGLPRRSVVRVLQSTEVTGGTAPSRALSVFALA